MEELRNSLTYLKSELQDLIDRGKAFTLGQDTEEFAKITQQLQYKEKDFSTMSRQHDILEAKVRGTEVSYVRLADSVRNAFTTMGRGLIDIPIATVKAVANGLVSVFSRLGNIVSKTLVGAFRLLGNVAKKSLSSLFSWVKRATLSMVGLGKSTKSANGLFNSGLKNILKYGLGIRSLYALINKLRTAMKEGFTNLYNDNLKFKESVDSFKASLLTMKNSLVSAFVPIVETAIPYIQRLVEWITKAADTVGQLMAALMGRKTYTKAIKQSAEASKDAAEATGDETKAIKKQLSPLDKLNVLTSENAKENEKSKEEDTGLGTMFEEIPISYKLKDIAKWLKDMWENSDFYELGKFLGEKLKSALDSIPWDEIKEIARKIGKSLATLINGFAEVEGLGYSIGKTLIEAVNTGYEFLNAFVHNLHWESVGKFIAETINGVFENIDWELIYDTFVTGAKGLGDAINAFVDNLNWEEISNAVAQFINTFVDTIYTFVTTTDWKKLGEKIGTAISDAVKKVDWKKAGETVGEAFKAFFGFISEIIENIDWWAVGESVKDFLVGIDWAGVVEAFFEVFGAAWGGFAAFFGGLITDGIESAKQYFQEKIELAGGDIVEGILLGIRDGLANIAEWLLKHVYEPFMEGFCKAFGIHSPSTVMAEMGKYIIQGLLNGLKSTWNIVVTWIKEKIQWLVNQVQSIFTLFSQANTAARNMTSGALGSAMGGALRGRTTAYSMSPSVNAAMAGLSEIEFPGYATGQVIPRTMRQHLAILGDNNRETEVVSPLSTIEQAVRNAIGGAQPQEINLNLIVKCEGHQLLQVMQKLDGEYFKQTGKHAFA